MFNGWTWDRRTVWCGVALSAALTGAARAGAEIGPLPTVTVPGITLPLTTSTVTLPVTTSTAVVLPTTTTIALPLTTTTVTLPTLPPTTTLARVSTTSLTLPLTTSTIVVPPTLTTLPLPLTTTTVTLRALPTTTLPVPLPTLPSSTTTTLPPALCHGDTCDDGFSCTDDLCSALGCLHVPIDARCVPPDACTAAVCAPALPGHDAAGCVDGAPLADGAACAEDGDACTTDVCRGGVCAHEPVVDTSGCAPVQDPLQQTLALGELTQGLETEVAAAGLVSLVPRLAGIESDLAAAARALAGEPVAADTSTRALDAGLEPAAASGITAEQRARIAFTEVLHTPREVAAFLDQLAVARERAGLPPAVTRDLHHRGHVLLRGTKKLKAKLRRLQRDPRHRHRRKRPARR